MKEVLLALLSGALETIGETKLMEALQLLHDNDETPNKDKYRAAVVGGDALCHALKPLTDKSKTPIDDAILNSLHDAIVTSAQANGVELDNHD